MIERFYSSKDVLPNVENVGRFIRNLVDNGFDLDGALKKEQDFQRSRGGRMWWCQLNADLVAVYAVLTGNEDGYKSYSGRVQDPETGKLTGTHAMGFIDGHKYDYCEVGDVKPLRGSDHTGLHLDSAKELIGRVFSKDPELQRRFEEAGGAYRVSSSFGSVISPNEFSLELIRIANFIDSSPRPMKWVVIDDLRNLVASFDEAIIDLPKKSR